MTTYVFVLKLVAWLSVRDNVTESQIRGYLSGVQSAVTSRLTTLVSNAPPGAQAVLNDVGFRLKVHSFAPGEWELYPKIVMDVTVVDGITMNQIRVYLEDYWDQAKSDLRGLIAGAPAGANAQIIEWHVHRLSGSVDEVEV